jgi:hypothetical protein
MSFQAIVSNHTPFIADKFVLPTPDGQEGVLVLVKATFETNGGGAVAVAEVQRPIVLADEHRGDPSLSSVRYESDLALEKPFVDVLIEGHVYAPHGRSATQVQASMRVGSMRKTLTVVGDRFWRRGPIGLSPSSPQPFERLPVTYERAFGGTIGDDIYRENPAGVGFMGARAVDPTVETEVPNFEYPSARVTSPSDKMPPAGFGVIGRGWQPRASHAGTYDAVWLADRWPLLPVDFDPRYCQSASIDQQLPSIAGGEPVVLSNLSEDGAAQFHLPSHQFAARFVYDRDRITLKMRLDTVLFEPDERRLTMLWRAMLVTKRRLGMLRKIVVFNDTRQGPERQKAATVAEA